jgi:YihY family inner membrane protein
VTDGSAPRDREEKNESVVDRVDSVQRRIAGVSFLTAVWRKYGDDGGGKLVAQLTYSAFLSLFPLLLVLVTVLGYILSGHPGLQDSVAHSAFGQFPIIGDQLQSNVKSVRGSGLALAIGVVAALWGGLGITQTAQDVLATIWLVPYRRRPAFLGRLAKAALVMLVLLGGLLCASVLAAVASQMAQFGTVGRGLVIVLTVAVNAALFALAFRILVPVDVSWRQALPGAVVAAIGWQVLLLLGASLVNHQLRGASQSYGFFGIVLGLLGWLALVSTVLILAAEVNAVLAHRLWPRSLTKPDKTEEDRRALEMTAKVQERAPDERVEASFGGQRTRR